SPAAKDIWPAPRPCRRRTQDTAAPDPNRSVSSRPPGEPAEIATPTGISLPVIVAQARGTKTGNQPRDVVAPRLADAARLRELQLRHRTRSTIKGGATRVGVTLP